MIANLKIASLAGTAAWPNLQLVNCCRGGGRGMSAVS